MRPIANRVWRDMRFAAMVVVTVLAASPAWAQRARNVFPDEGVGTRDAMIRVRELSEAGSGAEALRVLQKTVEAEGDQFLAGEADPDLYVPVRTFVNEMLLGDPELLRRYRETEGPRAAELLAAGRLAEVERTRLLTPAGFEAALRLAQLELESARFESARLMLEGLERHPDRAPGGRGAVDAAVLAGQSAAYLGRAEATAWAARWAAEAGLGPEAVPAPVTEVPLAARERGRTPLDPQPALTDASAGPAPLRSIVLDARRVAEEEMEAAQDEPPAQVPQRAGAWVFPTVAGGRVLVNDGEGLSAWDAATLAPLWRATPSEAPPTSRSEADLAALYGSGRVGAEDVGSVAVANGLAVAALGKPENGIRRGDRRLHAVELATGRVLWSADPAWLDGARLEGVSVRGPAMIEGDVVVVAARRPGLMRRVSSLYLLGIDLYTGALRWSRLVGSVGTQPWEQRVPRPEGGLLHEGIVYRGDDMGLLGAYEAATGRPRWLRLTPPLARPLDLRMRRDVGYPAYELTAPVVAEGSLFFIEPADGAVLRIEARTGRLLASRGGDEMGRPRYLAVAGDRLAAVGPSRVVFVGIDGFEHTEPAPTDAFVAPGTTGGAGALGGSGITGRVVVSGDRLLVPLGTEVAAIDPARPQDETRTALAEAGNLVVADGGAGAHLLSADAVRLRSYVSWQEAEALSVRRVEAAPADPTPLLEYLELARGTGRYALVPALADRVLGVLGADEAGVAGAAVRTRLAEGLLTLSQETRAALESTRPARPDPAAATPLRDLGVLEAVLDRLAVAAEEPAERAGALLEMGWLRETQGREGDAVEAYQEVLLDADLAAVVPAEAALLASERPGERTFDPRAGREATARLTALLRRVGPGPYAAFDEQARTELDGLPPGAGGAGAEALARRFPVAATTPEAWRRAGEAHGAAGRTAEARRAYGAGLAAAELGASIGREGQDETIGRLAGALASTLTGPDGAEPLLRLLTRLGRAYPGLRLEADGVDATLDTLIADARARLEARTGLARVGAAIGADVQVLEGWEPLDTLVRGRPGLSGDTIVMASEADRRVALWGVAAEDGRMRRLWFRDYAVRPMPVMITPARTLLFWPTAAGGSVEAIDPADGRTLWRTDELDAVLGRLGVDAAPLATGERLATPLDGQVRPDDLLVSADDTTLVLVQRRGRTAAFDIATGRPLWGAALETVRVFEIERVGPHLVVGGQGVPTGERRDVSNPLVLSLDARTGAVRSTLGAAALGDHSRWIRAIAGGDAVASTAAGLVRFDPATGALRWRVTGDPGAASGAGWVVGGALFVLDAEASLWRVDLADGAVGPEALETRGRMSFPVTATVQGAREGGGGATLAIASGSGLIVFDEAGATVGLDALEGSSRLEPPVPAEGVHVAIEPNGQEDPAEEETYDARLFFLEHPTGRLVASPRVKLYETPRRLRVLDGKILLAQGPVTLVLDAPR